MGLKIAICCAMFQTVPAAMHCMCKVRFSVVCYNAMTLTHVNRHDHTHDRRHHVRLQLPQSLLVHNQQDSPSPWVHMMADCNLAGAFLKTAAALVSSKSLVFKILEKHQVCNSIQGSWGVQQYTRQLGTRNSINSRQAIVQETSLLRVPRPILTQDQHQ